MDNDLKRILLPKFYSIHPSEGVIHPGDKITLYIKFNPTEIYNFKLKLVCLHNNKSISISERPHLFYIQLLGTAARPICHFDLDSEDTQLNIDSINIYECQQLQFKTAGLTSLNKVFRILNLSSSSIEFQWFRESEGKSTHQLPSSPFRCISSNGTIPPTKIYEMTFNYKPEHFGTYEDMYIFRLPRIGYSKNLRLTGYTRRIRVGFNVSSIVLPKMILSSRCTVTFSLINKEIIPLQFSFLKYVNIYIFF